MADSKRDIALVERIYGFNWASVGGRQRGLDELAEVVAPEFEWQFSEKVGGRLVKGVGGLHDWGYALEEDFSALKYEPLDFRPAPDGRVVVTGRITGVGRASRLPLSGDFGHVWTLRDGKALAVKAHLDGAAALAAVGLEP